MITGVQIREARRLLQWSRSTLAQRAGLSCELIYQAEEDPGAALPAAQLVGIVEALEGAGLSILTGIEGEAAVRWRWTAAATRGGGPAPTASSEEP